MNALKGSIMNTLGKTSLSGKVWFIFIDLSLDLKGLYFSRFSRLLLCTLGNFTPPSAPL